MPTQALHNSHLSEINQEFAPLVPAVNEAFAKIWTFETIDEFRGNWKRPATYPSCVPDQGFSIDHKVIQAADGANIELRVYKPSDADDYDLPLFFILHGGGWVVGSHDSENSVCRSVCVKCRAIVISVDYRRAPEYKFPYALNDAYDALRWVYNNSSTLGFSKDKIAAALTLKLRDSDAHIKLAGQVLNIPVTCHPRHFPQLDYELNSYEQNAESPTTNATHMRWFWDQYDPNAEKNQLSSPLLATSFQSLPKALIQVGGLDPLRDEGIAYAQALEQAGVPTTLRIYPGLPHGFMLAMDKDFTKNYYGEVVNWINELFSP
ncbi:hypothetical protein KCU93_g3575, partial [Aureobasidium melanogenum]